MSGVPVHLDALGVGEGSKCCCLSRAQPCLRPSRPACCFPFDPLMLLVLHCTAPFMCPRAGIAGRRLQRTRDISGGPSCAVDVQEEKRDRGGTRVGTLAADDLPCNSGMNLGTLLLEFLQEYGNRLNFERVGISVRDGGYYFSKADRCSLGFCVRALVLRVLGTGHWGAHMGHWGLWCGLGWWW